MLLFIVSKWAPLTIPAVLENERKAVDEEEEQRKKRDGGNEEVLDERDTRKTDVESDEKEAHQSAEEKRLAREETICHIKDDVSRGNSTGGRGTDN